ncbi:hypothetical protein [Bartonella koehlerae]|uniref:hypothetical protein n=1 Tax=Bartonella koehlerae TaxID=92181 RepID=UPI000552236B|nr:hypothetical protein [Bartonella koehlerae]
MKIIDQFLTVDEDNNSAPLHFKEDEITLEMLCKGRKYQSLNIKFFAFFAFCPFLSFINLKTSVDKDISYVFDL